MNWIKLLGTTAVVACATGCVVKDGGDNGGEGGDDDTSTSAGPSSSGAGGGTSTTGAGGSFDPPSVVSVIIEETVVRPWNESEEIWDGTSKVSPEDVQALAVALGATNPYAAATALIYGLAADAWAPPDPFGDIAIFSQGAWSPAYELGNINTNLEDQFISPWGIGWEHVPVEETMRISVSLLDEDLSNHDTIGTIELNYSDIIAAVQAGQVYNAQVSDQGQGNLLFVSISVAVEQP